MSIFNNKLRDIAFEMLRRFRLADDRVSPMAWSPEEEKYLNFCLDNEIVSKGELEGAVDVRIRQLGRESYEGHVNARMPPDHTVSPQALAFAIRNGALSEGETSRIKFDHGETQYTFFKGVEDTLVKKVAEQLRGALVPS